MASSLIRLKQLNQGEVSGLVSSTLNSSGFMTVAGINTSGFLPITGFNSTIDTSGFATAAAIDTSGFATAAAIDASGFMTITGIDVSGFVPSPITGITVTGSNVITGNVSFTGLGGTLILLNGNELQISGASEVSVGSVTGISIQSGTSLTGLIGITGGGPIGVYRRYDFVSEAYTNDIQILSSCVHNFKVNSGLALGTTVNLINGTGTIVSSPNEGECWVNISSDVALNSSLDASGLATQTYVNTKIDGSGFSSLKVTGSSAILDSNLTGIGGTLVTYDGTYVKISGVVGGNGGGGNITGFNSVNEHPYFTGGFLIMGTGGTTVTMFEVAPNISGFGISGAGGVGPQGPPGDSFINVSYYEKFPFTGNNIFEHAIQRTFTFTGYDLRCFQSGLGPDTDAGGRGLMSGQIYQRGINNTTETITNWTLDSGITYYTSGGFNVTVTGHNAIGLNITRTLSGMNGFGLLIHGTGV